MDLTAEPAEATAIGNPSSFRRRRTLIVGIGLLVATTAVLVPWATTERAAARAAAVANASRSCSTAQVTADPADPTSPMHVITSEVRDGSVLTFAAADRSPDRAALCEHDVDDPTSQNSIGFSDEAPREGPGPGTVTLMGIGGGGESSWTGAWGYAGDDVVALTVTTDTGVDVEATVSGGYWVAWWYADDGSAPGTGTVRTGDDRTSAVALRI